MSRTAATVEWDFGFDLHSNVGAADEYTLELNTVTALGGGVNGLFLLNRLGCSMGAPLRSTFDDAPQQDGGIPHPEWFGGYRTTLAIEFWENADKLACDGVLRQMNDLLLFNLVRMKRGGGRLVWTPSGADDRMVDQLWLSGDLVPTQGDAALPWVGYTASFVSPFPYAQGAAETTTSIADGASAILDNVGSTAFYPVIKAYGPMTGSFVIVNNTTGLAIVYDSSLPGASTIAAAHYIEFDCFRNTAYLDGDVASRKAGIDLRNTDFFTLEPGANEIEASGVDIDVLWAPAWA